MATEALLRRAGGRFAPVRLEAAVLSFESIPDGEVEVQIRPPFLFVPKGLHLAAGPDGALVSLAVAGVLSTWGAPLPASVFAFAPSSAGVTMLECKACGAPLELEPSAPICVCSYCRAPSIVHYPHDLPPDFVRHFCAGLEAFEPRHLVQLRLRCVRSGFFWGVRPH